MTTEAGPMTPPKLRARQRVTVTHFFTEPFFMVPRIRRLLSSPGSLLVRIVVLGFPFPRGRIRHRARRFHRERVDAQRMDQEVGKDLAEGPPPIAMQYRPPPRRRRCLSLPAPARP